MSNLKQKTLKVTVKTKHNKSIYMCMESETGEDYGNKKYIGIYKLKTKNGEPFQILDCRYETDYNFFNETLKFFSSFFGKNLISLKLEYLK